MLAKPRPLTEGAVFPYLVRALRNVAKDHWRSEQRRPQIIGDLDPEDPSLRHDREPHHEVIAQEVYEHVERLPLEFRNVVKAVDVFGLSYAQAAGTLRIPQGTVMSPPLTRPPPARLRDELGAPTPRRSSATRRRRVRRRTAR